MIVIRGTDVPTYVKLGSADIGIAGKDMLLELGAGDMYEPLDLNIARCKLMTAGRVGEALPHGRVRVATKFVNVARRHFAERGIQVDRQSVDRNGLRTDADAVLSHGQRDSHFRKFDGPFHECDRQPGWFHGDARPNTGDAAGHLDRVVNHRVEFDAGPGRRDPR